MILECFAQRCRLEREDGSTETFHFDLALPDDNSRVDLADISVMVPGRISIDDQPSSGNGQAARVLIELPNETVYPYSFTLRWRPAREDYDWSEGEGL